MGKTAPKRGLDEPIVRMSDKGEVECKGGGLHLEINLTSHWEGVRLPRVSGKSLDFPGSSPATSLEVLSLWNLTAIQRFPGSFPDSPVKSPGLLRRSALSLGSLTPSPGGSGEQLALLLIQDQEHDGFGGFGGSRHDGYPGPPHPLKLSGL